MIGDRALDREIGEKIFGYWLYHYDKGCSEKSGYYALLDPELACVGDLESGKLPHRSTQDEAWGDMPAFSYDITAAWRVVEMVVYLGFGFGIWSVGDSWVANFEQGIHCEFEAGGDTAPEAICRAALKVVEAGHFSGEGSDYA